MGDVRRMLRFWRNHRHCSGFREVHGIGYMLYCPVHDKGEAMVNDPHEERGLTEPTDGPTFTYVELRRKMIEYIDNVDDTATEGLEALLGMLDPNKTYTIQDLKLMVRLIAAIEEIGEGE